MADPIPDWFHDAIVDGVQLLHSLALDGRPAAEVVTLTATGWIQVLWRGPIAWAQDLDARRIPDAFMRLSRTVDRWPAPKQLLDNLPPRPDVEALAEVIPGPSPERRAALLAMRRRVTDRLLATPQPQAVRPDTRDQGGCPDPTGAGMVNPTHQVGADPAGAINVV